jgi:hypothetical protein
MPFQHCRVRIIGPALAPRLILAALNLSLVGLTQYEGGRGSSETSPDEAALRTATIRIPAYVVDNLKHPQASRVYQSCEQQSSEAISFQLDCLGSSHILAPCQGVGIVSDVDLLQQCLHVITPGEVSSTSALQDRNQEEDEDEEEVSTSPALLSQLRELDTTLHKREEVEGYSCVVRGNMQIPASLMYCISDSVGTPYLSSESCGEGSGKVSGGRTNLKRRGQQ